MKTVNIEIPAKVFRLGECESARLADGGTTETGVITLPAVLATEAPVARSGWFDGEFDEVLPMRGLDDSRYSGSLPLPMFFGHDDRDLPLGSWADVKVAGKTLTATGRLSRTDGTVNVGYMPQPIAAVRASVQRRELRGVSIGYRINSAVRLEPGMEQDGFKAVGRPMLLAKSWTLYEGSIVPQPADVGSFLRSDDPRRLGVVSIPVETWERKLFPVPAIKGRTMKRRYALILREFPAVEGEEPKDETVAETEAEPEEGSKQKKALLKLLGSMPDDEIKACMDEYKSGLKAAMEAVGAGSEKAKQKAFSDYVRSLPDADREFVRDNFDSIEDAKRFREIEAKRRARDGFGKEPVGSAGTKDPVPAAASEPTPEQLEKARRERALA